VVIDVAIIAPIPHLAELAGRGSFDMALTHLVLAHDRYARHYAAQSAAGRTVILDNSAYELEDTTGSGLAAGPVLKAAALIGAAEAVATDVPFDGPATLAATRRFLSHATAHGSHARFIGVPQGSTRREWLACYDALTALEEIEIIGLSKLSVPRCWPGETAAARLACAAELHRHGPPPKPCHLLGGDHSLPAELRRHRDLGHHAVRSNDSSSATWHAACSIPYSPATGRAARQAPGKLAFHRPLPAPQLAIAHANITILREHAGLPPH
jgi:hypothetical protein